MGNWEKICSEFDEIRTQIDRNNPGDEKRPIKVSDLGIHKVSEKSTIYAHAENQSSETNL